MKTVSEVIKELQTLVEHDPELKDAPVYVYADHGQTFIQANQISVDYTFDYDYYAEVYDLEGLDLQELLEVKNFVTVGD